MASRWISIPSAIAAPDRHPRIERAVGILEDDLHPPPELAERGAVEREDVDALEERLPAVGSCSRRIVRPTDDLPQPDSPTSAERLAPADIERHPVHRAHRRRRPAEQPAGRVVLHQVAHRQQWGHGIDVATDDIWIALRPFVRTWGNGKHSGS